MGGIGSGGCGGRQVVERAYTLSIGDLMRKGALVKGERRGRQMRWSNAYSGEITFEVSILADLSDLSRPTMRLRHVDRLYGEVRCYDVELETTDQPFGGVRLWFECPRTGQRVSTLHLPRGGTKFASRAAYGLAYRSQMSSPRDRALAKAHGMRIKMGADPSPLAGIPKPPGMRWSTYDARVEAIRCAEASACRFIAPAILALSRRLERSSAMG